MYQRTMQGKNNNNNRCNNSLNSIGYCMRAASKLFLIGTLSSLLFSSVSFAAPPQKDRQLKSPAQVATINNLKRRAHAEGSTSVIIELNIEAQAVPVLRNRIAQLDFQQKIKSSQERLLERVRPFQNGHVKQYKYIPFISMEVDEATLIAMQSDSAVKAVYEDTLHRPQLVESTVRIGATTACTSGACGAGQMVAILDTGVDLSHSFFNGKATHEACFSTNSAYSTSACPGGGEIEIGTGTGVPCTVDTFRCDHGTAVAGIAVGDGTVSGVGYSGVAPDADIMSIQVNSNNNGTARAFTSDVVLALEHVYSQKDNFDIAAVNLSLAADINLFTTTCDAEFPAMTAAIDLLKSVGIATVASSGNSNSSTQLISPGCISNAISVGAVDMSDNVFSFSNSANFLDLLAPAFVSTSRSSGNGGGFTSLGGTSSAAPHVAGAFAVFRSSQAIASSQDISVDDILTALKSSGVSVLDNRNNISKPRIKIDTAIENYDPPPVVNIITPADAATVNAGDSINFTGTAIDVTDGDISTSIQWRSDIQGDLGAGANINNNLCASTHIITASATDSNSSAGTDAHSLTVLPIGLAPTISDDSDGTNEDTFITIDVLANDNAAAGDTLTNIIAVTQASNGTVTNNGTSVTYTPNENYIGTDNFTYTVIGCNGGPDTATVTITVSAVNDAPTITRNTPLTLVRGGTAEITATNLEGDDSDDGAVEITYTVTSVPIHGQLEFSDFPGVALTTNTTFTQADINSDRLIYIHDGSFEIPGSNFADSFDFSLTDGGENGAQAVIGQFNIVINRGSFTESFAGTEMTTISGCSAESGLNGSSSGAHTVIYIADGSSLTGNGTDSFGISYATDAVFTSNNTAMGTLTSGAYTGNYELTLNSNGTLSIDVTGNLSFEPPGCNVNKTIELSPSVASTAAFDFSGSFAGTDFVDFTNCPGLTDSGGVHTVTNSVNGTNLSGSGTDSFGFNYTTTSIIDGTDLMANGTAISGGDYTVTTATTTLDESDGSLSIFWLGSIPSLPGCTFTSNVDLSPVPVSVSGFSGTFGGTTETVMIEGPGCLGANTSSVAHSLTNFVSGSDLTGIGIDSAGNSYTLSGAINGSDDIATGTVTSGAYTANFTATRTGSSITLDFDGTLTWPPTCDLISTTGLTRIPQAVDTDGDGIIDTSDDFPNDDTETLDTDNDGIGNNTDDDDDGDGVLDVDDAFPLDATEYIDTDGDGVGNNEDDDDDGDGIVDSSDNCPVTANPTQTDTDGDGVGDACETLADTDGDGIADSSDNCPATANPTQTDTDGDGLGDACDAFTDSDGDGIPDSSDNCPLIANTNQSDVDANGIGDVCDLVIGQLTFIERKRDGVDGVDGLESAIGVTVSPDGAHVYVASIRDDAVAVFSRGGTSGQLTFIERKRDGVDGVDGLDGAIGVTVSPDGAHVYVASIGDDAVAVFSRDSISGQLTFIEQLKNGVNGVDGIDGARDIHISPDGNHIYIAGQNSHAVAVFSRDSTTGILSFIERIHDSDVGGLEIPLAVRVSPEGASVYVTGAVDGTVVNFSRDSSTGQLTFVDLQQDGVNGVSGLSNPRAVVVSPDGDHVYIANSTYSSPIAVFSRDSATGQLTFVEKENDGQNSGHGISISSDGNNVYVTTGFPENAVAHYNRDRTSGELSFVELIEDGQNGVDGLDTSRGVTVSPDGANVYVAGNGDNAVAVFARLDYDSDGDGIADGSDNCPTIANPTQTDTDDDGLGDACDALTDTDGDGIADSSDAFPNDPTETTDSDSDGIGDNADVFPTDPTETSDTDGDGIGDNADTTLTVGDGDVTFLIAAINAANDEINNLGLDVIELAANGSYQLTTIEDSSNGNSGLPSITSEIIIQGNDASILGSADNNPCDGNGTEFRILLVNATGTLTLNNTIVSGGCTFGSDGGGVLVNGGSLNLNSSSVLDTNGQTSESVQSNAGTIMISR